MITRILSSRYLLATRGRLFARALTVVAIGSVALSVFAMLIVLSVMSGFRDHLQRKLLGFTPHIMVQSAGGANAAIQQQLYELKESLAEAFTMVPIVEGEVVAQAMGQEGFADLGVRVRGIDHLHLSTMQSADFFFSADLDKGRQESAGALALEQNAAGDVGLIVGSEVLYTLGLHPEAARGVRLTAPLGMIGPMGNLRPVQKAYEVRGFFRSGLYQQDSKLVLMDLRKSLELLGTQATWQWFLYLDDMDDASAIAAAVQGALGAQARVQTWAEMNQKLLGALQLERIVMTILLALTVGIACLSILGVVLMQVTTRQRDMAVLTALGASKTMIRNTVLTLGGWIGVVGSSVGLLAAYLLAWWCYHHPIRLPETFYLDYLPIELRPVGVMVICGLGVGLSMLAAWYPARYATRFDTAVGLRYE